jgi:ATP-binding cassette, subfamily B, bacterial
MEGKSRSNIRDDWYRLKRALALAAPKKRNVIFIIILTILVVLAGVAEPLLMKFIIDQLAGDFQVNMLVRGIAILLGLYLLKETVAAFSNWLSWRTRIRIHHNLLSITVGRLHILPVDFHRTQGTGAIMTKLERGIQGYVKAVSEIAFNVFPALVYLVLAFIVMFRLNWQMTLVVAVFTALPAFVASFAAPEQRNREIFLMSRWSKIYSRFNEVLSGMITVRSFAMEDYEKNRFMKNVEEANERVVRGVGFDSKINAVQNTIVALARIAAIAYGAYLIGNDEITLGTLIAYLGYIGGLFGPVQNLTGIYTTFQIATVSLEHVFEILDKQDFLGDLPDAVEPEEIKGEVEYKNVFFRYIVSGNEILRDFNLHVKPGESVAFVGPSGSGKTTLMALLQRFYDPTEGQILIDGYDLRNLKQISIRRQMGVVLQDALLFNESIVDNIRYGRQDAKFEQVVEAAKAANAHEFIMELPDGYDTIAGEKGGRLSGGERQRIAIARAILKDPPILILDEASSAMDAELEALVQEALMKLMVGRTTFIIAHRLNTVVNASRIVVLQKGVITELGTHRELMAAGGYYASLVKRQTHGLLNV